MPFVASQDKEDFSELFISLTQLLIVQDEESQDDYRDNYVRNHAGPIRLVNAKSEEDVEIGEIELFYFDGTRALDNDLDIVDVCDSIGQDQYDYAAAVYSDGALDSEIVGDWISNDVLALHTISILPEFRGRQYGLRVTRKIIETVGSRCGVVVVKPAPLQFSSQYAENKAWMERMRMAAFGTDQQAATKRLTEYWKALDLRPTKNPSIYCVSQI